MSHSSEEDTDLSESELEDYIDDMYNWLKKKRYDVKMSRETFKCPFCPGKKRQEYSYNDLLQHAKGVGKSSRGKLKEKGDHIALSDYLRKYHSPAISTKSPEEGSSDLHSHQALDKHEKFVWPWTGIVANLPVQKKNGRYVGESGSKLRDEYTRRGYNPLKVIPLWNYQGHTGYAAVNFNKDFKGFANAMAFEKSYAVEKRGRRDWEMYRSHGNGLYGWVAREADYNSNGPIGKHLRGNGDLRSIEEIELEESIMAESLVSNLTKTIESKDIKCKEMQIKLQETCVSLNNVVQEKDSISQAYNEEMKKIQKQTMEETRAIFGKHYEFKMKLESQKADLDKRENQLKKREANYDNEVLELRRLRRRSDLASTEQMKADEKVLRLLEEQKREKEELHKKIMGLQKEIDERQALELEIERLRGAAQVMQHMKNDEEMKKKMEELNEKRKEKEEELEDLNDMTQALIVKERNSNDELQAAHKELINELDKDARGVRATIGVKYVGELDRKLFLKIAKNNYAADKTSVKAKADELMKICRSHIDDHSWHPFKTVTVNGVPKAIVNEDDERLMSLKEELGEEICEAIVTAMNELEEFNPSGRYAVPQLWHLKEGRKATLAEGAKFILDKWKNLKKTKRK